MNTKELESYLKTLHPDLYSFSYILIPDDLQASQLIVDAIANVLIDRRELIDRILKSEKAEAEKIELKNFLFRAIYLLARKRFHQIKSSMNLHNLEAFYHLELDERALLFLKHKMKWGKDQMNFVTTLGSEEIVSILTKSRMNLSRDLKEESELGGLF